MNCLLTAACSGGSGASKLGLITFSGLCFTPNWSYNFKAAGTKINRL